MSRTSLKTFNCSVAQTLDIIGDKWTLLIIRDAFLGVSTFSEFQRRLNVARNVLTDRLTVLVENQIFERRQTKPGVERYSYHLSERGHALFPVLIGLMQWGDKWIFGSEGEPMQMLDRRKNAPIQQVAVMSRDGHFLKDEDVRFVPGPGAVRSKGRQQVAPKKRPL